MQNFGIEDMTIAIPSLYLPISDLATARGIELAKLRHGLGLIDMAVCDTDEDVVTLAAKAVIDLVVSNNLGPADIGRLYVGTESSIDGSKPIASYVLGLLSDHFKSENISAKELQNCDVVDMTFACIGAIDAMHNSLAWLHLPIAKGKVAIVVATDDAKYELASSGEYTQGAGATAILLKENPGLLTIDLNVGVATQDEHDFFKPLRLKKNNTVGETDDELLVEHKETPIFDGQFSNETYANRIIEAWQHFQSLQLATLELDSFSKYVFHLPYAYHGRRIMPELYFADMKEKGSYDDYLRDNELSLPDSNLPKDEYKTAARAFMKARTKTDLFKSLVANKIEQGERLSSHVGNVYTASVFLSLYSTLYYAKEEALNREDILLVAYGSGSKSKVLKGTVGEKWLSKVEQWNIEDKLQKRKAISFEEYVDLRCHRLDSPLSGCKEIAQSATGILPTNKYARIYKVG